MKSKLLYFLMSLLVVGSFWSCDDDSTEGMTRITYYAKLTLNGASTIYVDKGTTFTDPGFECTMNGEDVADQVQVSSNVDTSKSGVYSVNYSIVNADGFYSNASRKVVVLDPTDPFEGIFSVDPSSYRLYNGATVAFGRAFELLIINRGDGTYSIEDLFGGWYWQRAGYGTSYAMGGVIAFEADGSISMISSYLQGWGDSALALTDSQYDAATSTISYVVEYASGMKFYVTMYKNK